MALTAGRPTSCTRMIGRRALPGLFVLRRLGRCCSVLTIHNIAFRAGHRRRPDRFAVPDQFYPGAFSGGLSLKAGGAPIASPRFLNYAAN